MVASTWPASSRENTTRGRETPSSKPSRRMVSIRIDKCSSPRPETLNLSASPVSSTFSATLCAVSRVKRSRNWRLVRNLPPERSLTPANGESLTWKVIEMVGSSTESTGSCSCAAWFSSGFAGLPVASAQASSAVAGSAMPLGS